MTVLNDFPICLAISSCLASGLVWRNLRLWILDICIFPIAEWIVLTEQEVSEKSYEESPIEDMGRAGLRFF